jgi:hypothetical protein
MIKVPMLVMDAAAVDAVKKGTMQLSVGYDANIEWKDGKTAKGEHYDAIQHDIRVNHIALVSSARGGDKLTLGDRRKPAMDTKVVSFDGLEVTMPEQAANLVEHLQQDVVKHEWTNGR